jgi:hypothetical protein
MDLNLREEIENQCDMARNEVRNEWHLYELPTRDGHFVAEEAAKATRLLAMTLTRMDRLDKNQNQAVLLLKIIAGCLIFISVFLVGSK